MERSGEVSDAKLIYKKLPQDLKKIQNYILEKV